MEAVQCFGCSSVRLIVFRTWARYGKNNYKWCGRALGLPLQLFVIKVTKNQHGLHVVNNLAALPRANFFECLYSVVSVPPPPGGHQINHKIIGPPRVVSAADAEKRFADKAFSRPRVKAKHYSTVGNFGDRKKREREKRRKNPTPSQLAAATIVVWPTERKKRGNLCASNIYPVFFRRRPTSPPQPVEKRAINFNWRLPSPCEKLEFEICQCFFSAVPETKRVLLLCFCWLGARGNLVKKP